MKLEFTLHKKTKGPFYVGYAPVECSVKITDGTAGAATAIQVVNRDTQTGGQLVFYLAWDAPEMADITLQVPQDGTSVSFFIGGKFDHASINDGDAGLSFVSGGVSVLTVPMMVRVRKDANKLTPAERDRFLNAIVNLAVSGKYNVILDMHNEAVSGEIHGRASFLPWHRMFVLDLERHLQDIDASVCVPYWDFQETADKLFTPEFMGESTNQMGKLRFTSNNPLNNWRLNNLPLLVRRPEFDTQHDRANVEEKTETLKRGLGFDSFNVMEGDPHGLAHTSFQWPAPVSNAPTAPQDPLFFLIHANVDRLWAEWQMLDKANHLFNANDLNAYNTQGQNPRIGDFLDDTMWPWNGIKNSPRPDTAPGGPFISSPFTDSPGSKPKVIDTIDYQGRLTRKSLYFDYDRHPYISNSEIQIDSALLASAKGLHLMNLRSSILAGQAKNLVSLTAFAKASDTDKIVESLSNLSMLTDKESIEKAVAILKDDKNDKGARVLALSRLVGAVSSDPDLADYVLELLKDSATPLDLRKQALRTIMTIKFSSPLFPSINAKLNQILRGLTTDPQAEIREGAISYLAQSKDEFVQRLLVAGLKDPKEALVSEELAVHLLGYDIHAGIYPILHKVVEKSSNNDARSEAIHLLAGDSKSKDLLLKTFNNKKERFNIRKNSLLAIKQQSPQLFVKLAQETFTNDQETDDIRALSLTAMDKTVQKPENNFIDLVKHMSELALPHILDAGVKSFLKSQDKEENK